MKVFISWSGEFSRKVAERLSVWIPTIVQSVDVFYSPDDIAKGENWGNRLSEELEQNNFGIVCLTPENVTAPWIHFEAGALSKATNSRVSAIMLGVTPSDIKGPLARLQNTAYTQEDFFRLFQSISNSSDSPLKPETLKNAFDNSWERLMRDIDAIIKDYTSRTSASKENDAAHEARDSEAIQEILRIVRSLDNNQKPSASISTSIPSSPPFAPEEETIQILLPKDQRRFAAPIIAHYTQHLPPTGRSMGNMYKYSVTIPAAQILALKKELNESVPSAAIMI